MQGKYGRTRPYYGDMTGQLQVLNSGPVTLAEFIDGGGASGHYDLTKVLPEGAIPVAWKAVVTEAFKDTAAYTPTDPTTINFDMDAVDAITDSAAGFVDAGFVIGDILVVDGATTAANDGEYEIIDITADKITLTEGDLTATEVGATGINFSVKTTATISVGVSGDTGRFSADTLQSVETVATVGASVLAADACDGIGSDQTVRVTVTEAADFTLYNAGTLDLTLFYLK
jgi:Cu/Ag efflux protein CusF